MLLHAALPGDYNKQTVSALSNNGYHVEKQLTGKLMMCSSLPMSLLLVTPLGGSPRISSAL